MKDLHNNIHPSNVAVSTVTDNTPIVSGVVDTQGFNSLEFLIASGAIVDADATFAITIEDGDAVNLSDAASVPDVGLLGTELLAGFTFANDNAARKIGYKGAKRYVRCTVTPSANTGAASIAIVPLQGHPNAAPTSNPPV